MVDFGKLMQLGRTGVEGFMDAEPGPCRYCRKNTVRYSCMVGELLESTYCRPQDCPTLNGKGSRTTPMKNIKLLNDRLEAREQGNRSIFKRFEDLIEL